MSEQLTIGEACKHKNTAVKDSRPPDATRSDGIRMHADLPFDCFVIRHRACLDCGARIKTYEVPASELKTCLAAPKARTAILQLLIQEIEEFLLMKKLESECPPVNLDIPNE